MKWNFAEHAKHTKENGWGFVTMLVAVLLIVLTILSATGAIGKVIGKKSTTTEQLDNRPRWPAGGLLDHTGSHNANDVFGRGFGLDQTRKGTEAIDDRFGVKKGKATFSLGNDMQTEYNEHLGY